MPRRPTRSKGIGKGGTHSNADVIAPLLAATSSTAVRDGPTTRSSPGATNTTLGSIVDAGGNALGSARAADSAPAQMSLPVIDQAATVPQRDATELQQLMRTNADLLHQVRQLSQQFGQMQQSRSDVTATVPTPQRPRSPDVSFESVSYPAPPAVFTDGMFRFTRGTVEFLMGFSVGCMAVRLPDVLSQPVHTFTA